LENGDFETMIFSAQSEAEDRPSGFGRPAHSVPAQIWRTVRRSYTINLYVTTGANHRYEGAQVVDL